MMLGEIMLDGILALLARLLQWIGGLFACEMPIEEPELP